MELVVGAVLQHRDPPYHIAFALHDEKVGVRGAVERVSAFVQGKPHVGEERRDPLWAIAVQPERKTDKGLDVSRPGCV
jgi:hypothetical protein